MRGDSCSQPIKTTGKQVLLYFTPLYSWLDETLQDLTGTRNTDRPCQK